MPDATHPPHMTPDEFRARGHEFIDWIARYWEQNEAFDVQTRAQPGDVLGQLPIGPPQSTGGSNEWDAIVRDLDNIIVPGLTHWQSPGFLAFFPCQASGPAILGELVSAGLNVNGMSWATSPAATELEMRVTDWMAKALGLPESFMFDTRGFASAGGGCIQGTASESTLIALLAGKRRALSRAGSEAAPKLTAYASTQAHSSVLKAAMIAGIAQDAADLSRIRFIDTDDTCAMSPDQLLRAMRTDIDNGLLPCCVIATVGTTSSGAIDPVREIADVIKAVGTQAEQATDTWLHVDAAHLGAAAICDEHRDVLDGTDRADSLVFNAHKSLLTNFDCSLMWTRDRASLTGALNVNPEYLRNPDGAEASLDYRDWQIPLGRRFRALKLWFVMRHYGLEGLGAFVRSKIEMNKAFGERIQVDNRFESCGGNALLTCFRLAPRSGESPGETDARNRSLLERINADGRVYLSHSILPGDPAPRFVIRAAFGSTLSEPRHVDLVWEIIENAVSA